MRDKKQVGKALRWGRIAVQIIFFLCLPALFSQAFGGLKELVAAMGQGELLSLSPFVLRFLVLCGVTVAFGRIFCGWACAFGALGDWIFQISRHIQQKRKKRLPQIPEQAVPVLQKLKYLVLAVMLLLCFLEQGAWITKYSPWTVFSLLTARNFKLGSLMAAVLFFLLILVGMALQERFFCQFLCPLGAVFSLLPELPLLRLKRKQTNCIAGCQACRRSCPVSLKLEEEPLQEGECIRCGKCMPACPRGNINFFKNK